MLTSPLCTGGAPNAYFAGPSTGAGSGPAFVLFGIVDGIIHSTQPSCLAGQWISNPRALSSPKNCFSNVGSLVEQAVWGLLLRYLASASSVCVPAPSWILVAGGGVCSSCCWTAVRLLLLIGLLSDFSFLAGLLSGSKDQFM